MSQLPTLRQLQFLIALAEHGSFSRAAEAVFVTQPTLSAAIKELEMTLGTVLVERGARGAVLTPAGEAVLERARRVMAEAEDLVIAAQAAGEPLTGPFKQRPDIYNLYAGHTVFNRWSSADEVATAVAYLASDAASYVSGSTLFVDGGWTAVDGPPTGLTQLHR